MIGLEERVTDAGIRVVRVHYTADPRKRTPAWYAQARQGYTNERDWRREMEIDWTVASGLPVYAEEFDRDFHVGKSALAYNASLPLYVNWDFGLTPACVIGQLDGMARLNVLDCLVTWDGRGEMVQQGIERLADSVRVWISQTYPQPAAEKGYADPAGWAKSQTDEKSCVQILADRKFYPQPGPVTFQDRRRSMVDTLSQHVGGRAKLLIDSRVHMIIEGFEGAYRFEQIGETGRYKETVEKNAWSHPMNALEYWVGGVFGRMTKRERDEDDWRNKRKVRRDKVTGY